VGYRLSVLRTCDRCVQQLPDSLAIFKASREPIPHPPRLCASMRDVDGMDTA
jgi:hypothetical protein